MLLLSLSKREVMFVELLHCDVKAEEPAGDLAGPRGFPIGKSDHIHRAHTHLSTDRSCCIAPASVLVGLQGSRTLATLPVFL